MKIKAFTIVEIVLALLLASILIVMVLKFYRNIENFINRKFKDEQQLTELLFRYALLNDFRLANKVIRTEAGLKLLNDSTTVEYLFEKNCIVRSSSVLDSFKLSNIEYHLFNDTFYVFAPNEIVDRIEVHYIIQDEERVIIEDRIQTSTEYFN